MAVATFDTLKYANILKGVGVPAEQAAAQAAVLSDALAVNFKELVTKDDLRQAIGETEQRLNARIELLRTELKADITLLRWMVGLSISMSIAMLALLVRLLFVR